MSDGNVLNSASAAGGATVGAPVLSGSASEVGNLPLAASKQACCPQAEGHLLDVVKIRVPTPLPPRHFSSADLISTCYLCGGERSEPWNRDHVPPRQFYPRSLLKTGEVDAMEWLPVHQSCNESFRLDEEYFAVALGVTARTVAGHALMHDVLERLANGKQQALVARVESEFETPNEKHIDRYRVNRVATKVVRGFHFLRTGRVVVPTTTFYGDMALFHRDNLPDIDTALEQMGLPVPDEGMFPQVFRMKALITEPGRYTYILVLWETVVYILSFFEVL